MSRPDDLESIAAGITRALSADLDRPLELALTPMQVGTVTYVAGGPAPDAVLSEVLEDPRLIHLLTQLWSEDPPTPEHRAHLLDSPVGRRLLDRAVAAETELGLGDWDLALFVELANVGVSRSTTGEVPEALSATLEGGLVIGVTRERGAWVLTVGGARGAIEVHVLWSSGGVTTTALDQRQVRRPSRLDPPQPDARPVSVWARQG